MIILGQVGHDGNLQPDWSEYAAWKGLSLNALSSDAS